MNKRGFEICKGYENIAKLPTRGSSNSAGYDFYYTGDREVLISPGQSYSFETGIKVFMPSNEFLAVYIRSSIGIKRKLVLSNITPIIDSDYYNNEDNEGNIILSITNIGDTTQSIKPGERIAQGIFQRYYTVTDDDTKASKRVGGVGSTGK